MLRGTIGIIAADDDRAPEGERPGWGLRKADGLLWKIGAMGIGHGDQQGAGDGRVPLGGPTGNDKAGQAVGHYDGRQAGTTRGIFKGQYPFAAAGVIPIALLNTDKGGV